MRLEYLKNCINGSLNSCKMMSGIGKAIFNKSRSKIQCRSETIYWKYQENINFNSPNDIATLAKDILAFHNSIGGAIIFGVTSNYSIKGVADWQIPNYDSLIAILQDYIDIRNEIFIDTLKSSNKKTILVIFIHGRKNGPKKALKTGPLDPDNKPIILKGQYYIRQENDVYECTDPSDFERYFSGVNPENTQSYLYKIDEPYFRLLYPHYGQFFGRSELLDKINIKLNGRHPIIALDGVGGVGKSAIAIRLLDIYYNAQKYYFIVSLSAKNKVWTGAGHIGTRKAGFSGYTEFLREISKVLQININTDIETLETKLISEMRGYEGLLLVDNIEDIQDYNILDFLSSKVPDPVKVIVTSRVDRQLGALTIPIPEMDYQEAKNLLFYELEHFGYTKYLDEKEFVDQILKVTGCVPLAIKWAAALTGKYDSLKQASSAIRKTDQTKQEFLNFCLSTMYDTLSPEAKKVAVLYPYLANEWNIPTISALMDDSEDNIKRYINELGNRGLMLHVEKDPKSRAYFLPLTIDFLSLHWNRNKDFRQLIRQRLSELFTSDKYSSVDPTGILFNLPYEQKLLLIKNKTQEFIETKQLQKALKLIRIGKNWSNDPKIDFLEGRVFYESGKTTDGLAQMQSAHQKALVQGGLNPDDSIYLANSLLNHGNKSQEHDAFEIINNSIQFSLNLPDGLVTRFCKRAEGLAEFKLLESFLSNLLKRRDKQNLSYEAVNSISLDYNVLIFHLGKTLVRTLKESVKSNLCSMDEKEYLQNAKVIIEDKLSKQKPS